MSIHPEGDDIDEIISISVLDYLQKANLEETAQTFFGETMKEYYDPPIDSPTPFLLTWWETHWSTLMFGKQVHESNLLHTAPPLRPGIYDRNGSAVVPPFKFAPSLVMNNMFLQNYFNTFDREKKGFTSYNPMVVQPPVFPPDQRFNMSMMFPHIGPQQNQQTPATQPEEGHGRNELLSDEDNSNDDLDFGLNNEDGLHLGNIDKLPPSLYARAIVKNGKNCFERIKNQRKAIKAEGQPSLGNFDHRKLIQEPRLKNSKSRASQYRGVSRNGNQWQAIIMVHNKKRYIGSYSYETDAAKSYDKAALQYHGEKAKTNFTYAVDEIDQIRHEEPIISLQL